MSTGEETRGKEARKRRLEALETAVRRLGWNTVQFHWTQAGKLGLSATDSLALSYLSETGPIPAGRLSELAEVTTGAVTGIVDRLEKAGLVTRQIDPEDRRRVLVVPAASGNGREAWRLFDPLAKQFRALVRGYREDEIEVILDFVSRAADMLRAESGVFPTEGNA